MRKQGSTSGEGVWLTELAQSLAKEASSQSRYLIQREVDTDASGAWQEVWDSDLRRFLMRRLANPPENEKQRACEDEATRSTVREALILARLEHPGIVPLHELSVEGDGTLFATSKRVAGEELASILQQAAQGLSGWTPTRVVPLILRVCEAVSFAHERGVVHGRLSSDRVVVGRFGEVFVLDWGSAHAPFLKDLGLQLESGNRERPDRSTRSGEGASQDEPRVLLGTSPAADVYSIGAMLYHLLTGPRSSRGESGALNGGERRPRHSRVVTPSTRGVEIKGAASPELAAVCTKAMARDPSQRYSTVLELAEDLRAYLEDRVVKAYEIGAIAELRKWVRRNRPLAATIAIAFLATVSAGVTSILFAMGAARDEERSEAFRLREEEALGLSERRTKDLLALSASYELDALIDRAEEMWPPDPARLREYDRWLLQARDLVTRLEPLRIRRGILKVRNSGTEKNAKAPGSDTRTSSTLTNRWWRSRLDDLIVDLEAFSDEETGLITGASPEWGWGIERRMEFAREAEEQSLSGDEARLLWEEAIASIRDVDECPMYGGLRLEPQFGLVPVGRDPTSGLWEFAHLQSGAPPERNANGDLELQEESGIVLVLLPGGTFRMGAQRHDPNGPNFDLQSMYYETPVHSVSLHPFFISKYEMTVSQWIRTTSADPTIIARTDELSRMRPVASISWDVATRVMRRLGLHLPTEQQWEYAARGGTETPWWTGVVRDSLIGAANLADRSARELGHLQWQFDDWPEFWDGYPDYAPVDSLRVNPFGLHHVAGNVAEWISTPYFTYGLESTVWAGITAVSGGYQRVVRGGGLASTSLECRSSFRWPAPPTASRVIGVRPARDIDG